MHSLLNGILPISAVTWLLAVVTLSGCHEVEGQPTEPHHEPHKIFVTSPAKKDVTRPEPYVCQIHSRRHIEVRALAGGYLEEILVKEGQVVKQGDVMFNILPTIYKAKLAAEKAEVDLAQIDYTNTEKLFQQKVVAQPEVALAKAKLEKAEAQMKLAEAELNFASVRAPFDGIVDHQHLQQGSLISEGDVLTTLSDNGVMWAYFNVPESNYLEYQSNPKKDELKIELVLANGAKFPQEGSIGAIEADFNNENGNIAFRADFPNPERILRHGQTGTVLVSKIVPDAVVIPQRAKFEILAKNYVYVLEEDPAESHAHSPAGLQHESSMENSVQHKEAAHGITEATTTPSANPNPNVHRGIVRQREIDVLGELDDIYLIKSGIVTEDRIILEGIRQVRDGDIVEYEYVTPDEALTNMKYHAE